MKKVAVITLNYNGKKDTVELLESLKNLQFTIYNLQLKTIVVDNASSDNSVSEIHKKFPQVDILQTGQNLGFAGGFNKGIEYAQIWGADYLLLINNDTLINDESLLEELIKTAESDPKIGLVSPKIYFAKGFEFHKDRYKDEDLGKVIWFAGGKFDSQNIGSIHAGINEVDNGQYATTEESEIFSGACVLIKKEVVEKAGFLNEDYFLYFEDSEYARRAKDLGFKIYYTGKTSIYHKVSQSTGIGSLLTDYFHTRNRLYFGMQYSPFRTQFALFREALKFLMIGRQGQKKGVMDFFKSIKGGSGFARETKDFEYPFKLSIGIVNYKTPKLVKNLLKSIFDSDSGFNKEEMEIIILDNGSADNLKQEIENFLPRIKYLENEKNTGFSGGYNKTIKYSLGQYYLMLNSDTEVLSKGLSEILKAAESYDGNACISGKLFFPDQTKQDSVFHLPTIRGAFKEYFLGKSGSYFMYQPEGKKPVQVEGAVMACFLIPRKVIEKVGLLDEGTFIYFEDIEYCRRLKRAGIPFYFIPSAQFIHHHGASSKKIGVDKSQALLQKAARRYHGFLYYFLLSWVLKIGQKIGRVKTPVSRWTISD